MTTYQRTSNAGFWKQPQWAGALLSIELLCSSAVYVTRRVSPHPRPLELFSSTGPTVVAIVRPLPVAAGVIQTVEDLGADMMSAM